jgi:hypothetical protein
MFWPVTFKSSAVDGCETSQVRKTLQIGDPAHIGKTLRKTADHGQSISYPDIAVVRTCCRTAAFIVAVSGGATGSQVGAISIALPMPWLLH